MDGPQQSTDRIRLMTVEITKATTPGENQSLLFEAYIVTASSRVPVRRRQVDGCRIARMVPK